VAASIGLLLKVSVRDVLSSVISITFDWKVRYKVLSLWR